MSWDIFLFNTNQRVNSIEELKDEELILTNFCKIIEQNFKNIVKENDHREVIGEDFSFRYYEDSELVNNKMLILHGENGLFEIVKIAKSNNWIIFDTGSGELIDLENPSKNGLKEHKSYVKHIMKKNTTNKLNNIITIIKKVFSLK
jgi:hypothetical protein